MTQPGTVHHIELYVSDLERSLLFWEPLLAMLGHDPFQEWEQGRSFLLDDTYIVLVQAEADYLEPPYHRKRVGLNHLAFHARSRAQVDEITGWAREGGHTVLYEDRHPYAGGPDYYALFCEDPDRIKVEIVAPEHEVPDDADLLASFESGTLPFALWKHHRTHTKIAFLLLRAYGFDEALARLQVRIRAINDANGVPDGPLTGYNETTTHAYLRLIDGTMRAYGDAFPTPDSDSFVATHPQLSTKHALRLFYSPERRLHPDAKMRFVEPDLAPLPRIDAE